MTLWKEQCHILPGARAKLQSGGGEGEGRDRQALVCLLHFLSSEALEEDRGPAEGQSKTEMNEAQGVRISHRLLEAEATTIVL